MSYVAVLLITRLLVKTTNALEVQFNEKLIQQLHCMGYIENHLPGKYSYLLATEFLKYKKILQGLFGTTSYLWIIQIKYCPNVVLQIK